MIPLIIVTGIILLIVATVYLFGNNANLNKIKSNKTGDGQFGTADWASSKELKENLQIIDYNPKAWRKGNKLPTDEGIIVGAIKNGSKMHAYIDKSDNHTMIVAAPGGGKTTTLLYPNLEYSAAVGMSGFVTDTKGDVSEEFVPILQKHYNCSTYVIDLRYPLKSSSYNFLYLVNKYIDRYKTTGDLSDLAMAEGYAKAIANNIIHLDGFKNAGQNQFFYTSAEGVIAGVTLLVSEFCSPKERHIVSVFKVIEQLMEVVPESLTGKNPIPKLYLSLLYSLLPSDHTAKDLLAPTATSEFKTIASVMSTAMSVMLRFIDKEIEQILCFDDGFNIDDFVKGKSFIFFVVDEKSESKNFMVNLIVRQIYGELLKRAEIEPKNRLPHRVIQWLDEFGTYSKINGAEQMFSAGRSRNIITVPIIQSLAQLDEKYGKDSARIIKNSCQNIMFSFQAPTSDDSVAFSKNLGTKTITTGSVTQNNGYGNRSASISLNMKERNLMNPDEITRMKKGDWILMKAGMNPSRQKLYVTSDWGIKLEEEYHPTEHPSRSVSYASRNQLIEAVRQKYDFGFTKSKDNNYTGEEAKTKFSFNPNDF